MGRELPQQIERRQKWLHERCAFEGESRQQTRPNLPEDGMFRTKIDDHIGRRRSQELAQLPG